MCLDPGGVGTWPAEYPQEFQDLLPALAGYRHYRDTDVPGSPGGYYVAEARHRYDVHEPGRVARGLPLASLDPGTVVSLRRGSAGGEATATGGIASTRRGNAASWAGLCGSGPAGDWTLGFGAGAAELFDSGRLEDVVLVVGWTGRAPAWSP